MLGDLKPLLCKDAPELKRSNDQDKRRQTTSATSPRSVNRPLHRLVYAQHGRELMG